MADKPIQLKSADLEPLVTSTIEDLQEARGAVQAHDEMVERFRLYYQAELSESDDPPAYKGASRPRVTFCQTATAVIVASIYPQLFGTEPIAHLEPYVEEASTCAEMLESFYQRIATRYMGMPGRVGRQGIHDSLTGGAVISHHPWRRVKQLRWEWVPYETTQEEIDPVMGAAFEQPATEYKYEQVEKLTYNMPWCELVDTERVVTMPTQYASIQESAAVAVQWPMREQALWQGVADGTYSREAVEQVLSHIQEEGETTAADTIMRVSATPSSGRDEENKQPADVPWITDVYFRYSPKGAEHATSDWLLTIYEPTQDVLQCRPSPYNVRPFAVGRPYTDTAGIRGQSLPMVGGADAEKVLTLLSRNRINKAQASMLPVMGVSMRFYKQLEEKYGGNLERFAGLVKFVPLPDEMFSDAAGKPYIIITDGITTPDSLNQEEMTERYGNVAVGSDDAAKGVATPTAVTATQAQEIAQQSQKRMAMIVERLAGWIVDMFTIIHEQIRQFHQEETVQELWVQVHGEEKAAQYPLWQCYQYEYEFSANGLSETMSQAVRAEHAMAALQMAMNDPMIAGDPAAMYQLKADAYRYTAGKRDPKQVLGSQQTYVEKYQAMMQQQAMMEQQQAEAAQAEKVHRMVYERKGQEADRELKREGMDRADAQAQAKMQAQLEQAAMAQGGGM